MIYDREMEEDLNLAHFRFPERVSDSAKCGQENHELSVTILSGKYWPNCSLSRTLQLIHTQFDREGTTCTAHLAETRGIRVIRIGLKRPVCTRVPQTGPPCRRAES